MSTATTPAECLRSELEREGFTIEGLPDDLTWDRVIDLTVRIGREFTRHHNPAVAALLDAGDPQGAAEAFLADSEARR